MRKLFARLWNDQDGILYAEYLILATILVLGVIVGVSAVTAALNAEFTELADAYLNLNASFSTSSFSNNATFLNAITTYGLATPFFEKRSTFRFTIGRTF